MAGVVVAPPGAVVHPGATATVPSRPGVAAVAIAAARPGVRIARLGVAAAVVAPPGAAARPGATATCTSSKRG